MPTVKSKMKLQQELLDLINQRKRSGMPMTQEEVNRYAEEYGFEPPQLPKQAAPSRGAAVVMLDSQGDFDLPGGRV